MAAPAACSVADFMLHAAERLQLEPGCFYLLGERLPLRPRTYLTPETPGVMCDHVRDLDVLRVQGRLRGGSRSSRSWPLDALLTIVHLFAL